MGRRDPELAAARAVKALGVMLRAPDCQIVDQVCQATSLSLTFKHIEASVI